MNKRVTVRSYLNENTISNFLREEDENIIWITNNLSADTVKKLAELVQKGNVDGTLRVANDFAVDVESLANKGVADWAGHLGDGLKGLATDIGNKDFGGVADRFGSGIEGVKNVATNAADEIKTVGNSVGNSISNAFSSDDDSENVVTEGSQNILTTTMDMLSGFVKSIGSGLAWIWETIAGAFTSAGEYLASAIRSLFSSDDGGNTTTVSPSKTPIPMGRDATTADKEAFIQNQQSNNDNGVFSLENCITFSLAAAAISIIAIVVYKVVKWIKNKKSQNVNDVAEMYVFKYSEINRLQESTFYFIKNHLRESTSDSIRGEFMNMVEDNLELEADAQSSDESSLMGKIKKFMSRYFTWILGIIILGGIGGLLYAYSDNLPEPVQNLFERVRLFFGGEARNTDKLSAASDELKLNPVADRSGVDFSGYNANDPEMGSKWDYADDQLSDKMDMARRMRSFSNNEPYSKGYGLDQSASDRFDDNLRKAIRSADQDYNMRNIENDLIRKGYNPNP